MRGCGVWAETAPVHTTASWPIVPFKVHKFVHWAPRGRRADNLQLEKDLHTQVELRPKQEQERKRELKVLLEQDQELCEVLCMPHYDIDSDSVPSLEELYQFRQHLATLRETQVSRREELVNTQRQIILCMEELDHTPDTSFERHVKLMEYVTEQWEMHQLEKEQARQERQLKNKKQNETEMLYGSSHRTPNKLVRVLAVLCSELPVEPFQEEGEPTVLQLEEDLHTQVELRPKQEQERKRENYLWNKIKNCKFMEHVTEQWEMHQLEKEQARQQRQLKNKKQNQTEMLYGNSHRTPNKRVGVLAVLCSELPVELFQEEGEPTFLQLEEDLHTQVELRRKQEQEKKREIYLWNKIKNYKFMEYVTEQWEMHKLDKEQARQQRQLKNKKQNEKEMLYGSSRRTSNKLVRVLAVLCSELPVELFQEEGEPTILQLEKDSHTQVELRPKQEQERKRENYLWNKIKNCRQAFAAYYDEDYTGSLLQVHDAEVVPLRNYYGVHKELLEGVQKYKESWRLFFEFERKPSDPSRFTYHGGNLLKEENNEPGSKKHSLSVRVLAVLCSELPVEPLQEEGEPTILQLEEDLHTQVELRPKQEQERKRKNYLWNKIKNCRQAFAAYYDEDYTGSLLQVHDAKVVPLRNYYEVHKELLEGMQKWEESWRLFLEFKRKPSDPSRFTNRGGNLLKEEKQRARLQKTLFKLEEELKAQIEMWEETLNIICGLKEEK
ncbi:hypothetical protein QTO34_014791 [Cnephaeus nilssonii]|uniref:Uncharacterized protein n=1 Tax=Cnephaeus nilssonii TaxID=3371016 RepID=A0AA40I811_CNENI|nr:hypothetical protein QTO34_014791 [Eptesicus nilssonii]